MQININTKFYDLSCIQESIQDFHEVCDAVFDGSTLTLDPKGDVDNLKFEFLNYVLGLMKNKGLV